METIALSAGHSLTDPGAVNGNVYESAINMALTAQAADMLRKHSVGVLNVPDSLNLSQTIAWINARASQVDLCVEIHINAGGGNGVEGWYYQGGGESKKLTQFMVDSISAESNLPKRGIDGTFDETTNQWGKLGFIHDTIPLASLVECGFIDNTNDFKLITSIAGQKAIAKGICRGILGYLGLAWKPELIDGVVTPPVTPPQTPVKDCSLEVKKAVDEAKRSKDLELAAFKKVCQTRLGEITRNVESIIEYLNS